MTRTTPDAARIIVTRHAAIRYLERIKGMPVRRPASERRTMAEAFAEAILPGGEIAEAKRQVAAAVYVTGAPLDRSERLIVVCDRFQAVLAGCHVITVKRLGDRNKSGATEVFVSQRVRA